MTTYTEDELADLKREFWPRKRRVPACSDRMCGASDCQNCNPDNEEEEHDDNPTESTLA